MRELRDLLCTSPWAILPEAFSWLAGLEVNQAPVALPSARPLPLGLGGKENSDIAVLPLHGVILPYTSALAAFLGATCLDALTQDFCSARDNPDIAAIVLDIDSPGGVVTGVHAFSQLVYATRSVKPIVGRVTGLAASAAYWIAASSSKVVLDPTAMVGSIGVVATLRDNREALKKAGVEVREIVSTQSPSKRLDSGTPEGRAPLQQQVDTLAQVFIQAVADYRNVSPETVQSDFGQGGLKVGAEAVAFGMADGLLTPPSSFSHLTNARGVPIMTITHPEPIVAPRPAVLPNTEATEWPDPKTAYDNGFQAGLNLGKTQERERILSIEAQSLPGHEALIAQLKYDGVSTARDAALQILTAEKAQRRQMTKHLVEDAPIPLPPMEDISSQSLPLEAQCAAEWQESSALQGEFSSLAAYTAYRRAENQGVVKC